MTATISLISILLHWLVESVDNSTQVASHSEDFEGMVQGTTDESKTVAVEAEPSKKQKKMHWTAKVSKKKKTGAEGNADQNADENAPKRGGRQPEKNTTEEISLPDDYRTIPRKTSIERTNHLQRISRYWPKRWFNYQRLHPRYAKRFAFAPSWDDCIAKSSLKNGDPKVRPRLVPADADPSSIKRPEDYPDELKKRAENAGKRKKKAAKKALKEQMNIELTKQDIEKKKELAKFEGC